eukprot:gene7977-10817_t
MSRSALEREHLVKLKVPTAPSLGANTASVVLPPLPPSVMPLPPFPISGIGLSGLTTNNVQGITIPNMLLYQNQMTIPNNITPASLSAPIPFVPIPLTGEDDDNEPEPGQTTLVKYLPIHGNQTNFNINNLLFNNIMENEYFRALYQLRTYHEVIDEIYRTVTHVEPWSQGTSRIPSSPFCLLVKLLLMKLTVKQMNGLLNTSDGVYIRAIGFLYLRYACSPTDLWKWYEPYLEDEEELHPSTDKSFTMTIGEFCIKLLTDMNYYNTTLPRIPVPIERKMKVMLLLLEEKKRRRRVNLRARESGAFADGDKVRAIYSDAENEPAWYDAVIDYKDNDNENKYWVTFPEYGNQECIDLGDMELIQKTKEKDDRRKNSRDRHHGRSSRDRNDRDDDRQRSKRGRSRSDSRKRSRSKSENRDRGSRADQSNLLEKVLNSDRERSAAIGRNYGHRPTSYKGSLSLKLDRYTVRQKSPSPEHRRPSGRNRSRSRSPMRQSGNDNNRKGRDDTNSKNTHSSQSKADESMQNKKLKMLMDRYGDASAK